MPEPISLDELPGAEGLFGTDEPVSSSSEPDKVPCPECGKLFLPTGVKRHITMAHRGGVGEGSSSKKSPKVVVDIADRWAQFQRGSALMVSFACTQCAAVMVEDADKDGQAIALFCAKRPKLRHQLEAMLDASDILILVGTLGETAKKMASHHEIGRKIGLDVVVEHESHGANGMQGVAQFMQNMDPAAREELINGALNHMANGANPPPQTVPEADWSPSGV